MVLGMRASADGSTSSVLLCYGAWHDRRDELGPAGEHGDAIYELDANGHGGGRNMTRWGL